MTGFLFLEEKLVSRLLIPILSNAKFSFTTYAPSRHAAVSQNYFLLGVVQNEMKFDFPLRPRRLAELSTRSTDIEFNTTFPVTYTIGKPGTVEWSGGNGQPVNVSLSDGDIIQSLCS